MLGLELEGRTTVEHQYLQLKETRFFSPEPSVTKERLLSFEGESFDQIHTMLPFGLEYTYKNFFLRAEGFIDFLNDKYRSSIVQQEGHGLSFWVGYIL